MKLEGIQQPVSVTIVMMRADIEVRGRIIIGLLWLVLVDVARTSVLATNARDLLKSRCNGIRYRPMGNMGCMEEGIVVGMVVVGKEVGMVLHTRACSVEGKVHSSSCCLDSSLKALQLLRRALP